MGVLLSWSGVSEAAQTATGWSQPEVISSEGEWASSPTLVADATGAVHAFWMSQPRDQSDAASGIAYSRLQDGQWSTPVEVMFSPGNRDALFPRAAIDATGRLHLFWSSTDQGPYGPLYHSWAPASNAADARQWQPAYLIADGTYQSDVKIDSLGRLHVLYASVLDSAGICHVMSDDFGDTWSNESCIPRNYPLRSEEHEVRPRLALDSQDTLHAVWMLDDYSAESRLRYVGRAVFYAHSLDGGATWSEPQVVDEVDGRAATYDEQADGLQPEWGSVIVDRSDRVHIVWVGRPDMQRYHQWSEDGGRTWTRRQVAIPSGGYNNWQGLAVDDNDHLHLLWPSLKGMEYAWWDGGAWSPALLLSDSGSPHHAQAVVALGNQLQVVWQDHGGEQENAVDKGHIVYATVTTDAPARAPQVLPTPVLSMPITPTSVPTSTPTINVVPTQLPGSVSAEISPPAERSSPGNMVAIGVIPAALVVGVVLLLVTRKR